MYGLMINGGRGYSDPDPNDKVYKALASLYLGLNVVVLTTALSAVAVTLIPIMAANPKITVSLLKAVSIAIITGGNPVAIFASAGIDELTSNGIIKMLEEVIQR